jgi:hypothetical protein
MYDSSEQSGTDHDKKTGKRDRSKEQSKDDP